MFLNHLCGRMHGTGKCMCAKYAQIPLRLALALVFIYHGWLKLQDPSMFAGYLTSLHVPLPELMAWVVTIVELGGGIAVLLGFWTSIAAALIAVDMVFAIFLTYGAKPYAPGTELEVALLAIALSLAASGGGMWSSDSKRMEKGNMTTS